MLRRTGVRGVVRLREDGADASVPYLALELVHGVTLGRLVERRGVLTPAQVRVLGALLAEIVAAVHGRGVVHGDLKPANVLCPHAGPLLIDFDAAATFEPGAPGGGAHVSRTAPTFPIGGPADERTLDAPRAGAVLRATPRWLAPEVLDGTAPTGAADVYALGALLAFMASGGALRALPGPGERSVAMSASAANPASAAAPPVMAPELERMLDRLDGALIPIVRACMERHPARRPSAAELVRALLPRRRVLAA